MNNVEELLKKEGLKYDTLQAPEEMERHLSGVLARGKGRRGRWPRLAIAASLLLLLFFTTYHYDALAYYGKKLLGYDGIISQTLKDLNELGKGQEIGKKHTFSNGVELILDGIMMDDNQLLAFFRMRNMKGQEEDWAVLSNPQIKGVFQHYWSSFGQGSPNEEKNEMVWVLSFAPPKFYEKNLVFLGSLEVGDQWEEFRIPFQLDPSKAMGHSIKQKINRNITIEDQKIHFDSILATKTQTVIKGSLASPFDLVLEQFSGEQVRPEISVDLIADGKAIEAYGTGISTTLKGIWFEHQFDALPEDLKELKIKIKEVAINKKLEEMVSIEEGILLEIEGQEIDIQKITIKENQTEITIETEENVLLSGIELIADGEVIPLKTTHSEELNKTSNGILKRRTIVFEGTGGELQLKINRIHYIQECNEILDIPI